MAFRSSTQKHQSTGRPAKPNVSIRKKQYPVACICKKHPKHQQSPGVCSICLNERLSQLSSTCRVSTARAHSSCSSSSLSSLSSSSDYSATASSNASPVHHHRDHRHYRKASGGKGLSEFLFKSGKDVLAKSRSVASGVRRRRDAEGQAPSIDHHGKKKGTFWSRLLDPKNKRVDAGLSRSRTTN